VIAATDSLEVGCVAVKRADSSSGEWRRYWRSSSDLEARMGGMKMSFADGG